MRLGEGEGGGGEGRGGGRGEEGGGGRRQACLGLVLRCESDVFSTMALRAGSQRWRCCGCSPKPGTAAYTSTGIVYESVELLRV